METAMNKNGKRKRFLLLFVTLCCNAAAVTCSAGSVVQCQQITEQLGIDTGETQKEYVLYIGLDDKESQTQKIPTEAAVEQINEICKKYVDGYTYQTLNGGWRQNETTYCKETTLAYQFTGADETAVRHIMDEVLPALNQECILVHVQNITCDYYYNSATEDGKAG